jgi:hypothetical protein
MTTSSKKPTELGFISFCHSIGFRFYDSGIMDCDAGKVGMFLKGDMITPEQRKALIEKFGRWVAFYCIKAQYAPEQTSQLVVLLSKKAHDNNWA